nr:MAG TPA: hypothetical protein [Caudoviricetes sp.]
MCLDYRLFRRAISIWSSISNFQNTNFIAFSFLAA